MAIRPHHDAQPCQVDWDVELALCGCGLPLPDCIEDDFLSKLSEVVVRSFTQQNPISIDLNKKAPVEGEDEEHLEQ